MLIRDALEADLPAILQLHNHHILNTLAIWQDTAVDLSNRQAWHAQRHAMGYPVLVADVAGEVAGYASYGPFRSGSGYERTVENSIYVNEKHHRRGVARALLAALLARAREADLHVMVAAIGLPNAASVALHAQAGFAEVGQFKEVGLKNGVRLDLMLMQRLI